MLLEIEDSGSGYPLVLLHGLTATRRYVLQGSQLLARKGYRLVSYDARGHGESDRAQDPAAYEYSDLAADALRVLDEHGLERPVLIGHSMGAATAMRIALEHPNRVAGLVQITPAYAGTPYGADAAIAYWDRLAAGLETDGVDGFLRAYEAPADGRWRDAVLKFTRQRMERHRQPGALVQPLRIVPRSEAFAGLERLREVPQPVLIVASRDAPDPGHPLAVSEAYAAELPDAELLVEEEGEAPLAWQGAQLSRAILAWLTRTGLNPA